MYMYTNGIHALQLAIFGFLAVLLCYFLRNGWLVYTCLIIFFEPYAWLLIRLAYTCLILCFFSRKRKWPLRFIALERKGIYILLGGRFTQLSDDQWTSQDDGKTTLSPWAPAFAQHRASSLILSTSSLSDGLTWSKTHAFLCFQIIHGTKSATDFSALRSAGSVDSFACSHQSMSESSCSGAGAGKRRQDRISCHVCLVKGHASIKCLIVSGSWSHRRHRGWCCRPRRASRSAVQQRSCHAIQRKNFTFGGARLLHMSFQEWQPVAPRKVAR